MRAVTILIAPTLAALALLLAGPGLAQSADEVVSRGVVNERERGEPLIAIPQALPADVENRSPNNFTIIVDPMRTGADGERRPGDMNRPRR